MARNKVITEPNSYFLRLLEPAFLPQSIEPSSDPLAAATYVTYMDPSHKLVKQRNDTELGLWSAATSRWYDDARVSHVTRVFNDALHQDVGGSTSVQQDSDRSSTAQLRHTFDTVVQKARTTAPGPEQDACQADALSFVMTAISDTIASMLLLDPTAVSPSRAISDHSVGSLIAAELRNWLYIALGYKVSMVDFSVSNGRYYHYHRQFSTFIIGSQSKLPLDHSK
jgi:hypothetical protein